MRLLFSALLLLVCYTTPSAVAQDLETRIYGKVTTTEGDVFQGLIRWDKNEASWVDVLDGSKKVMSRVDDRKRGRRILGIRFNSERGPRTRTSGIRFGHIQSLENTGSNEALLTLRSGEQVTLSAGSTDIGNDVREIIVEDTRRGVVELRWRDLDRIDFAAARDAAPSKYGERLYGTLETRDGDYYTGYICWDVDEVLTEDILDGTDKDGRKRKIAFGDIARIERNSSSRAGVTLRNGEEVVLRGSNDVNNGNRGILVLDPRLGQVRVSWRSFAALTFEDPPPPFGYHDFVGGGPLRGIVYTRDGEKYAGTISWDDDEAAGWELLNGTYEDLDFAIEFTQISEIARRTSNSATVTLRDGRTFDLRGSNDVDDGNSGIVITTANGDTVLVDWDDFDYVRFEK